MKSDELRDRLVRCWTGCFINLMPKKVIYNPPATIVIWEDGEKTVVKLKKGTPYDPETGFLMCLAKKAWGDRFHAIMRDMVWENEDAGKSIVKWARRLIAELPQLQPGGNMVWSNDTDTPVKNWMDEILGEDKHEQ